MKRGLLIFMVIIMIATTVGCQGSGPAKDSVEKPAVSESDNGTIKIGIAMASVQSAAFNTMAKTLETKAKELGAEPILFSAEHDLERQIDQIQDLITSECDAIIINAVDSEGVVPIVEEAREKGIKVLAIDRKIAGEHDYAIETDNIKAGAAAGHYFAEVANEEDAKVLLLISDPTATALRERQDGFKEAIKEYPNLKIVSEPSIGTSSENAYNATIDAFSANPDIRFVFTSGDIWIAPIQSALVELDRQVSPEDANHVYLASVDGEKSVLDSIKAGTSDACIVQLFTDIARKCMEVAVDFANGKTPEKQLELYDIIVVTRDNIETIDQDTLWGYSEE